jgi:hypothetical protein
MVGEETAENVERGIGDDLRKEISVWAELGA